MMPSLRPFPSVSPTRRGALATGLVVLLVVVGIVAIAGFALVGVYNGLAAQKETVAAEFAKLDSQYKRRADLIPQLVETVKGSANYEKTTLQAVVDARASVGKTQLPPDALSDPDALRRYMDAQNQLGGALSRLLVVAEQYPDLKATQGFLSLQDQIEGTENRIAVARRDYIEAVRAYNTSLRTFPSVIWAKLFFRSSKPMTEFAASEGAETPPEVKF